MDEHTVDPGNFYGVYILVNSNPSHKGRIYIGFTTNPAKRIRQHNREIKGGARQTGRSKGPWDMVMIIHGFPSRLAALQFEWAWQQPKLSKRLKHVSGRQKKQHESYFEFRFRVVCEMLNVGPWSRLPLVIRWLKQEYKLDFPVDRQPPLHMSVAYGPVIVPKVSAGKIRTADQASQPPGKIAGMEGDVLEKCRYCGKEEETGSGNKMVWCIYRSCSMRAHLLCLASHFLRQNGESEKFLLPISGVCDVCGVDLLWKDVVQQRSFDANHECQSESESDSDLASLKSDVSSDDPVSL